MPAYLRSNSKALAAGEANGFQYRHLSWAREWAFLKQRIRVRSRNEAPLRTIQLSLTLQTPRPNNMAERFFDGNLDFSVDIYEWVFSVLHAHFILFLTANKWCESIYRCSSRYSSFRFYAGDQMKAMQNTGRVERPTAAF